MRPIIIPQSSPRHIASNLNVQTVARWLSYYSYAELRLMEAQAGWLAFVPQYELKIELGYQLYDDATHVNAMRARLPEVGAFGEQTQPPNEAFVTFCNELTNSEDLIEQFVGVYQVLRPHLAATYRHQISHDDNVANFPTVRLLQHAIDDHEKYATWGQTVLHSLLLSEADWTKAEAWRLHLLTLLNVAGGVTGKTSGDLSVPDVAVRDAGPGKRFRSDPPVRDSRFRIEAYHRHEGRAATDVWDRESLVNYMFMMVEGEIEATENCGRTLFDFPNAPWELRYKIAQQLWDEARHAELSLQRFWELGGKLDMLPVRDTFPLYLPCAKQTDIAKRLVQLNQVIEGWVMDDFAMMVEICRGLGDERSARLFEYLLTDEWLHIKIGADWLPRLTTDNPVYRNDVVQFRTQTENDLYQGLKEAAQESAEKHRKTAIFNNVIA